MSHIKIAVKRLQRMAPMSLPKPEPEISDDDNNQIERCVDLIATGNVKAVLNSSLYIECTRDDHYSISNKVLVIVAQMLRDHGHCNVCSIDHVGGPSSGYGICISFNT